MSGRICVFGTSNGIIKDGYISGLEGHDGTTNFKNFSIGSSCSFVFYGASKTVNFRDFDWVILDYCVNDGLMLASGANSLKNWCGSLEDIAAKVGVGGANPVLLMLPAMQIVRRPSPVVLAAHQISARLGLPIFDGYAFIQRIVDAQPGLHLASLFREDAHLHPWLAKHIGWHLAAFLHHAKASPGAFGEAMISKHTYELEEVQDVFPADRLISRKTSLTERQIFMMPEGAEAYFKVNKPGRVVGVSLNLTKSCGVLKFKENENTWKKSWTSEYVKIWLAKPDSLILATLPVKDFSVVDGLKISVLRDGFGNADESLGRPYPEARESWPCAIELNGLILESVCEKRSFVRPFASAVDVQSTISDDDIKQIATHAFSRQEAGHSET